jgi:phosphoribosylformylglycinamidine synthase
LGELVRCVQGCYDAAVAYGAPFISGKDSLNNEYTGLDGSKQAIPGTLLISALGIVPDVSCAVTVDLKQAGDLLYVVGVTAAELGGSSYGHLHGVVGGRVPQPPLLALEIYRALHRAMAHGLVRACHDCSEGGLSVAVAEMGLAGGLGLELSLAEVPRTPEADRDDWIAFSESLGRLVLEVAPEDAARFEDLFRGLPFPNGDLSPRDPVGWVARAGRVCDGDRVLIRGLDGRPVIKADLKQIEHAWRGHLAGINW